MKIPILILATITTAWAGSRPYGQDLELLRKHTPIIELKCGQAAPAFQGRVMTSTATGPDGSSFGWLNERLVAQGILPEENPVAAAKLGVSIQQITGAFAGK